MIIILLAALAVISDSFISQCYITQEIKLTCFGNSHNLKDFTEDKGIYAIIQIVNIDQWNHPFMIDASTLPNLRTVMITNSALSCPEIDIRSYEAHHTIIINVNGIECLEQPASLEIKVCTQELLEIVNKNKDICIHRVSQV
jgi:uncharacterized protein YunC (DUF1805 family)